MAHWVILVKNLNFTKQAWSLKQFPAEPTISNQGVKDKVSYISVVVENIM